MVAATSQDQSQTTPPRSLHGILKATWAGWMGDNLATLQREARVKDAMIARSMQATAAKEADGDDMQISVDSPVSNTNQHYHYPAVATTPAWVKGLGSLLLAIVAIVALSLWSRQPTATVPPPSGGQTFDIRVDDPK